MDKLSKEELEEIYRCTGNFKDAGGDIILAWARMNESGKFCYITEDGKRFSDMTFDLACDFYNERARVRDDKGWYHVKVSDKDTPLESAYSARYSWVGEFKQKKTHAEKRSGKRGVYISVDGEETPEKPDK